MSLSPETKTAVLKQFVAGQRARRRRTRVLFSAALIAVVAGAAALVIVTRDHPSDARAVRFVDAVSYGQRGHLRIAQMGDVDVIVYDSSQVLSWIVAYGRGHAGERLCLSGQTVAERCFGPLGAGEDGTVNLSWSGRRDLAAFDVASLRDTEGSVVAEARLVKRTG
jgi:hypothetical protein